MTVLQEGPASGAHIVEPGQLVLPANGFHLEPRCRICRNDAVREKVNGLVTSGSSYAMVLRALEDENLRLDKRDRVTIDSIRDHPTRRFPVHNAATAPYRATLEQRAKENAVDFVQGVATAITPMALDETFMVRGYQTLIDPETKVDVNTAMIAAGQLQAANISAALVPLARDSSTTRLIFEACRVR